MKAGRYAWVAVGLLWVVACLNYVDRQVIFSVFPLIGRELKLSDFELGLLSTVFLWVYGVASPLGGYFADRVGRKKALVLSLGIWTTVTLATGFASNFGELVAARAAMGLSEACYLPAALALIAELHGEDTRSLATGIHQSGLYGGMALGGVVGGWMGERQGWRAPFVVLGVAGLVYAVVLVKGLRGDAGVRRGESGHAGAMVGAVREVMGLRGLGWMPAAFTGFSAANWVVYTWMPSYIYERFPVSLAAAGFSATFYLQAASFAGILAGGWMADRWSRRSKKGRAWTQAIGLAAAAPFLFLVGVAGTVAVLVAGLVAFGVGKGLYDASTMPVLAQVARPELRATGYGLFNLAGCVAGGVMAAGAGALKPAMGLAGAIEVSAVLLVGSAWALWRVGSVVAEGGGENGATA